MCDERTSSNRNPFCDSCFAPAAWRTRSRLFSQRRAPLVTAETEHWYQTGEPLEYAGHLYYRAGAPVYFNGIEMVRTGYHKGVPLYSRSPSTIEPSSTVFVPLSGGFVQPYERLTGGHRTGRFRSRFRSTPGRGLVTAYPVLTAPPPMARVPDVVGADSSRVPAPHRRPLSTVPSRAAGMSGSMSPARASKPAARRPQAANGVFIEFDGARWFSSGPATNFDPKTFTRIGDLRGLPVYTARGREATIFVRVAQGLDLVAPYSKRSEM